MNVRIYRFRDTPAHPAACVVWCPTQNQTTVSGYRLALPAGCTAARLVTLSPMAATGTVTALTVPDGSVPVDVSEMPVIVLIGADDHRP